MDVALGLGVQEGVQYIRVLPRIVWGDVGWNGVASGKVSQHHNWGSWKTDEEAAAQGRM